MGSMRLYIHGLSNLDMKDKVATLQPPKEGV